MATVATSLAPAESVLLQYAERDISHLVPPMIDIALARREIWTLIQREVRHLDAADRSVIESRYAAIVHTVTASVSASNADLSRENCHLIACAMLSVAGSPSTDPVEMDLSRYRTALENIEFAVLSFDLRRVPARRDGVGLVVDSVRTGSDQDRTGSRVALVEDAAVGLFHRIGYAAVTVDDIGAAAGISGPAVYHYVSSKAELLVDVLSRAVTMVADGARTALARTGTPDEKLRALVRSYCTVAATNRELFGVYITEAGHVPVGDARRLRELMARDVDRWIEAVMRSRPGLDVNDARVRVFAARRVVTDMVRLERTDDDRLAHVTELLALTVLRAS